MAFTAIAFCTSGKPSIMRNCIIFDFYLCIVSFFLFKFFVETEYFQFYKKHVFVKFILNDTQFEFFYRPLRQFQDIRISSSWMARKNVTQIVFRFNDVNTCSAEEWAVKVLPPWLHRWTLRAASLSQTFHSYHVLSICEDRTALLFASIRGNDNCWHSTFSRRTA